MKLDVQLFALARDLAGRPAVEVELPERATVIELRRALCDTVPALAPLMPHLRIAVDSEYADDTTAIRVGAEVACIPPVSGG